MNSRLLKKTNNNNSFNPIYLSLDDDDDNAKGCKCTK